jgi:hypothetical protein
LLAVVLSLSLFVHDARHGVDLKFGQKEEHVYELMVTNSYASIVKSRQRKPRDRSYESAVVLIWYERDITILFVFLSSPT